MQLNKLIPIVALATLCLVATLTLCQDVAENKAVDARAEVDLPKIFDFERFKSMFGRSYKSVVEELARKKIFLARAFQVFLSYVGYRNYKRDSLLKITPLADWTVPEFEATLNKRPVDTSDVHIVEDPNELLLETPVASEEEIRAKLAEIKADPKNAELARELDRVTESRSRRRRRETTSGRRDVSLDDLMKKEKDVVDRIEKVPSNNPEYEAPELSSFGADDGSDSGMGLDVAELLKSLPGAGVVGGLFSAASNYLYGAGESTEKAEVLPDKVYVDHRDSGCFGPVKNQRSCGSCYIFSTTALYEWQFCKEYGKRVSLSEQYPLDCGERVRMKGCAGGLEQTVSSFYGKFGVELKDNYPYRYRSDACPYDPYVSPRKMGYIKLNEEDGGMRGVYHKYLDRYIMKTPILMGIGVSDEFHIYARGVDDGRTCKESRGHSMLMVGSGRENGKDYWLFRNSYGPDWGDKGHYKLAKSAKHCLLDDGLGLFLQPTSGSTVFDLNFNRNYDKTYVGNRYNAVMRNKFIPENPINDIYNKHSKVADIATPPPSLF